ncbi:serine/threonine protein kinase [Spirulina sp. CCNP1310]|uniref:serine/threonine protein kinase n=1 Tax=Spirulina sp. CCNP1310 TaxID=3110249 RepID=UPI002B2022B5|nr:serine/threonine protein kinase [Spirulina sp. CCNP1310]
MLGQLLDGRYRIQSVLGAGGFGQTYLAEDLRRPGQPRCVVKHLHPASNDPDVLPTARRLFATEAEILEKLGNHPQLPRLLAYFETDQEFYLVQDFIDGLTLATELIPGQQWPEAEVLHLLREVLTVLVFVHSQGVIHRDIKPDNILRQRSDRHLFLVDFGAVKQIQLHSTFFSSQSNPTIAIGTPGYMASEQAHGRPTFGSDLYSLGVIAIQALTGVPPSQFQYNLDTNELEWDHSRCSPELGAILTQMTRYLWRDRPPSAEQILATLPPDPLTLPTPQVPHPTPQIPLPHPDPLSAMATYAVAPQHPTPAPTAPPPPLTPRPRANWGRRLKLVGGCLALSVGIGGGIALHNWLESVSASVAQALTLPPWVGQVGEWVEQVNDWTAQMDTWLTPAQRCEVVNVNSALRVRATPNGKIINGLKAGTIVRLTGNSEAQWQEIQHPKGWVYGDFLRCEPQATESDRA